ncbi:hypothetical protein LY04_00624 [Oceanimonas baumannii]|uniref:DUF2946 domain-containing protein n=1 Tax=Oceanimonas baumannii TaxID=129578 RepID=A0ABY2F3W4_9GAMM|nr:hypothetical protein LY04_00624 [Oceanimonas baumannii]
MLRSRIAAVLNVFIIVRIRYCRQKTSPREGTSSPAGAGPCTSADQALPFVSCALYWIPTFVGMTTALSSRAGAGSYSSADQPLPFESCTLCWIPTFVGMTTALSSRAGAGSYSSADQPLPFESCTLCWIPTFVGMTTAPSFRAGTGSMHFCGSGVAVRILRPVLHSHLGGNAPDPSSRSEWQCKCYPSLFVSFARADSSHTWYDAFCVC